MPVDDEGVSVQIGRLPAAPPQFTVIGTSGAGPAAFDAYST